MKIKLLIIFLILSIYTFAKEKFDDSEFFYIYTDNSLNLNFVNGVYSPFVGIGGRQIYGKNGFDWNISIEPYPLIRSKFKLASYNINGNYIRYLKSERKNKYYFGGGASLYGLYTPDYFYLLRSPTFILGKHIYEKNKIYIIQLKINWPNFPNIWVKDYFFRFPKIERHKRLWTANIFITTAVGF